jgi:hypothetical protein
MYWQKYLKKVYGGIDNITVSEISMMQGNEISSTKTIQRTIIISPWICDAKNAQLLTTKKTLHSKEKSGRAKLKADKTIQAPQPQRVAMGARSIHRKKSIRPNHCGKIQHL